MIRRRPTMSIAHEILTALQAMTAVEAVAVVTGFVCVALTVRESVWSWPIGLVSSAMYVLVFHGAKLYADMALQVVYLGMGCYGWYRWARPVEGPELPITRAAPSELGALAALAVLAAVGWGHLLATRTDASLPYVDATLVAASLAAQWLLTRKKLENWAIWIVADVAYVGMFAAKGLWLSAVLYAAFTALAVAGLARWVREWRR